jgi:hypothetical protein
MAYHPGRDLADLGGFSASAMKIAGEMLPITG